MLESYWTVFEDGTDEIVEKKSRFIAYIAHATSKEEAMEYVEKLKKTHWDARHHCYAFRIGSESVLERCSDDGEPSGTAGKPMLEVLAGREICDVVAVVVRYFGGTLLGTGGLVRAYTKSMQAGLEASTLIEKKLAYKNTLTCDYGFYGKIQHLAETLEITIVDSQFTDMVTLTLLIPIARKETFVKKLTEASSGSLTLENEEEVYYGMLGKEVIIFDDEKIEL